MGGYKCGSNEGHTSRSLVLRNFSFKCVDFGAFDSCQVLYPKISHQFCINPMDCPGSLWVVHTASVILWSCHWVRGLVLGLEGYVSFCLGLATPVFVNNNDSECVLSVILISVRFVVK